MDLVVWDYRLNHGLPWIKMWHGGRENERTGKRETMNCSTPIAPLGL